MHHLLVAPYHKLLTHLLMLFHIKLSTRKQLYWHMFIHSYIRQTNKQQCLAIITLTRVATISLASIALILSQVTQNYMHCIWQKSTTHREFNKNSDKEQYKMLHYILLSLSTVLWWDINVYTIIILIGIEQEHHIQCESKKVPVPLKLSAIFSLRLSVFPWNFAK